jgi:hypothetical protein
MTIFKPKTVKLINTTGKTYNGYKPNTIINTEEPERYLLEGWKYASFKSEAETSDEVPIRELKRNDLVQLAQSKNIITAGKKKEDLIRELEALENGETEEEDEEEEEGDESDPDLQDELE